MHFYLNGKILSDSTPAITIADRGFMLGDGLFETFKIINKKPLFLQEHLDRLSHGACLLSIPYEITYGQINEALSTLIHVNRLTAETLSARLTLTRGPGPRGILPPKEVSPTILLTIASYTPSPVQSYSLWVPSTKRNECSPISNIKSIAYTDNILGRIEATKNGADDALFLNTKGFITSTSMCNVFIIRNNRVITPPIADGVLPGILRGKIIEMSKRLGIDIEERSITLSECLGADGAFVTNSLLDLCPVGIINNQAIKNHSTIPSRLSEELMNMYSKIANEGSQKNKRILSAL